MNDISLQKQNVLYRTTHRIYRRQRFLIVHGFFLANWVIISLFIYVLNERSTYGQDAILFTLLWMGIFAMHFFYTRAKERQDQELIEVINTSGEKRKMHYEEEYIQQRPDMTEEYRLRLGDDGELVHGNFSESDLSKEEIAYYEQQQRNQRG